MTRVEVEVEAIVNPTESVEKVERALRNILGEIDLQQTVHDEVTVLRAHMKGLDSLRQLKDRLRQTRIREAARAKLTNSLQGNRLTFGLNKQAAYAGRVSFYRYREAPLGPIQITICGDVNEVLRYLCEY